MRKILTKACRINVQQTAVHIGFENTVHGCILKEKQSAMHIVF